MDPNRITPVTTSPTPSPRPFPSPIMNVPREPQFSTYDYGFSKPVATRPWYNPNAIADRFFAGFDSLGGWWKETKGDATSLLQYTTETAARPSDYYSGYTEQVARTIARSDELGFDEAMTRVPSALRQGSKLSNALGYVGSTVDGIFGVLDVAEAYHNEGQVGPETTKTMFRSVAQTSLGSLTGYGVGAYVAGTVGAVGGWPLIVGLGAGAMISYLSGRALDAISG